MSLARGGLRAMSEDDRIKLIGDAVMEKLSVGILLEDEASEPGKIARYIAKLKERYPQIAVAERVPGPIAGVETIRFVLLQ